MLKKLQSFLGKTFLVWEYTSKRKWIVFIGIMLFSFLFKWAYEPFGMISDFGHVFFADHALITGGILLFQFFVLPYLFGGYFQEEARTRGREIAWIVILFMVLIIFHGVYNTLLHPYNSIWEEMKMSARVNLGIGVYPIAFILILARIRQLNVASVSTKEKKTAIPIVINPTEKFEGIPIIDIVFIKSLDNYSEIHYVGTEKAVKKLIRKSLLVIENNLISKGFLRVHRSFIINLDYIESVEGNANKTMIKMKNGELLIPVSRTKRQEVLQFMNCSGKPM